MYKLSLLAVFACALSAQVGAPPEARDSQPIFRVTVVERTTNAVSYRHRSGWTKVDLRGTPIAPEATGHVDVNSRPGYIEAKATMDHLQPAQRYGPEYLTYVLWAITPEGRAKNLGEVVLEDTKSHLDVTTDLQAFALIVTAEPYFGVTQPSDVVVMENIVRDDTLGKVETTSVKFDLLKRGVYTMYVAPGKFRSVETGKKIPLQLLEAENAVQIAQYSNADRYAKDVFDNAADLLRQAEAYQARKNVGSKPVIMTAREAVQTAETARLLSVKRQEEERIALEKKASADREAAAQAQAAESARQRALADQQARESDRQKALADAQARESAQRAAAEKAAADAARAQADAARAQSEADRLRAEQSKQAELEQQRQAEQARLAAQQSEQKAQEADRLRAQAEQAQQQLRLQLLQQFNMILETRDTARGLIVTMSDVLFDFNKYTLRAGAKEKLAKISGIILSHPGLKLEADGYTDSIGTETYNMKLSEERADAVRGYLTAQGLASENVTAKGFGKDNPVATNDSAAGRQQNRRVELVVSGEIIGQSIGSVQSQR
jgi:outer membrane protein OmpA-like peptidoglycan-associated protein